ncbi:MAG: hypothetical protein WA633_01035 [Stellaceae bacterium]
MAKANRDVGLRVSSVEIERMAAAARTIRDCRRDLGVLGEDPIGELIAGGAAIFDWRHYPDGEVYDSQSHAQYFFHAHPADSRSLPERGHFHTFLRAEGMPAGVAPLLLPELAIADAAAARPQAAPLKRGAREEVSHLIAISIDGRGEPIRLFTTNRWVTGETWYRAEDVIRMLDCFVINEAAPAEVLNRWIGAVLQLFRPQIAILLRARDEGVMAWRRRRRTHVFEDPRLEVTSSLDVNLDAQLEFIDKVRFSSGADALPTMPGLPPMAEGWEASQAG